VTIQIPPAAGKAASRTCPPPRQAGPSDDYLDSDTHLDGLTPRDVARLAPWATEYRGHDGVPCWHRDDLLADGEGPDNG
jgi:hypothetical protein